MRQGAEQERRLGERRVGERRGPERRRLQDGAWLASGQADRRSRLDRRAFVQWLADRRRGERRGQVSLH